MHNFINLESNVVHHCNNSCVACSHYAPISPKAFVSPESLFYDLQHLAKFIHTERFVLLGGEPLLHPRLLDLIQSARESHISDRVVILTNGNLLDQQPDELWNRVDEVMQSVYPDKNPKEKMDQCIQTAKRLGKKFTQVPVPKFIKTYSFRTLSPEETVQNFKTCFFKTVCFTMQDGWLYRCPQSWHTPRRFMGLDEHTDGLDIHASDEKAIVDFLTGETILKSCARCSQPNTPGATWIPWHECKREDWLTESGQ